MDAFDGGPVWLASASFRDSRGTVATGDWTEDMRRRAKRALENVLAGAGHPGHQRLFRMNVTMCLHRAASAAEVAKLKPSFWQGGGSLAGGPVEILEERGMPGRPRELPCENPGRYVTDFRRPDLWLPVDCERCPPCLDRLAVRRDIEAAKAAA